MENTDSLLSPKAARAICGGLSASAIRRKIADGTFPAPVVLSRRADGAPARIAYVEAEVRAWIAEQIASRDSQSQR